MVSLSKMRWKGRPHRESGSWSSTGLCSGISNRASGHQSVDKSSREQQVPAGGSQALFTIGESRMGGLRTLSLRAASTSGVAAQHDPGQSAARAGERDYLAFAARRAGETLTNIMSATSDGRSHRDMP